MVTRDRKNGAIKVEMAPVRVDYYNQVIVRLVDYINVQVLMLFLTPDLVTANEDLLSQLQRQEQPSTAPVMVWARATDIVKKYL
jgi:hypothetical protein